jgi:hypothetical protein
VRWEGLLRAFCTPPQRQGHARTVELLTSWKAACAHGVSVVRMMDGLLLNLKLKN